MSTLTSKRQANIELSFSPSVTLVSVVRRFVLEFYQEVVPDPDLTSRLALATHELLENAVKYSSDDGARLSIWVERHEGEVEVAARTWNRSSEAGIARLRQLVADIQGHPDAEAFYQDLMRKSLREKVGSGLGLARICAEALLTLDLLVTGDLVEITARGSHPLGQP